MVRYGQVWGYLTELSSSHQIYWEDGEKRTAMDEVKEQRGPRKAKMVGEQETKGKRGGREATIL